MPNRHLERSGCRRREADLLTDALGVAKVDVGQPGRVWHLELARLPEADAVGLKRGAWGEEKEV